ncbi:hypothetical protein [uncultured Succinivibrio sp.]|uniref:hypothetical protein n=1 Tax=uncultured Succinivibrio sp. TaxID=540749 RepID=UPI0025D78D3D|nr:hypothetical protein [uncultured Succinivibrio sp.]
MKKLTKSVMALSLSSMVLLTITGCATSDKDEDCCSSAKIENALQNNPAIYNRLSREKADRISRELTMSYYTDERRSAAIEEGGFKHTLGMNNPLYKGDEFPQNVRYDLSKRYNGQSDANGYKKVPVTAVFNPNKNSKDYSYYELGRWQRLCDGSNGKNMDRLDWRFVKRNKDAFPMDLLDTCVMPSSEVLSRHGISTPVEYRNSNSKTSQKDVLPNSVYPYLIKDHTPSNTPIVIKEPTVTVDDSFVSTPEPYFEKAEKAKTSKVRPYAKSTTDRAKAKQITSDVDWIEKEIN